MSSPVEAQSEAEATAPIAPGAPREPAPGQPALHPAALRRDRAASPLHKLVRTHLATFLARFEDEHGGRRLPRYVEDEFLALLRCGDPTFGFVRLQCRGCQADLLVPFSCKGRGFCPTCGGRRMNETSAHLVERVLPPVPVRQWVLSLPWHLRFALAGDPALLRQVARAFLRAVSASYRRRGRRLLRERGEVDPGTDVAHLVPGAVNFVQRFGSSLALNVHCHALFLDGVHVTRGPTGPPEFLPAPELQPDQVVPVHRDAMRRIHRALHRAGRSDLVCSQDDESTNAASDGDLEDPSSSLLPLLHAASIQDRVALGPDAGRPVPRLRELAADLRPASQGLSDPDGLTSDGHGFSLHAATRVDAADSERLEALIRYVARPALAQGRLEVRGDGKVKWTLRKPWRDGTRAFVFDPLTFLERLAALVPHPREHGWTYHGSLAPASTLRDRIVPRRAAPPRANSPTGCDASPHRRSWAELFERTFAEDVLRCPRCGGRRHRIATITDPLVARRILRHIGARHEPLPLAPARPPPQGVLSFA